MRARTSLVPTAVAAVAALALTGCTANPSGPAWEAEPTAELEVMSWWTSGSEAAALSVLLDGYAAGHPGVDVVDAAVAGGAGSNVQVQLASRIRDNNPPDVWQTFVGQSLQAQADSGLIVDASFAYDNGLAEAMVPEILTAATTADGRQYGVPSGSHRQNVLWFNPTVLAEAGVEQPAADDSIDDWIADLEAVSASGTDALCLGGKDRFAVAELFENVLLSTVGSQTWPSIAGDQFDWDSDQSRQALARFGNVLDNSISGADALSWDAATAALAAGDCAYLSMNDSAYGELVASGSVAGEDFDQVPFPGTSDAYLAVVDTFVIANGAANPRNGYDFLTTVSDPAITVEFNQLKGSVPVRTDVDASALSAYQQQAYDSLVGDQVLLSITQGELMRPAFQQGFYDAVMSYRTDRDSTAFVRILTDSVNAGPPGFP